jgi:hypothetical protein
VPSRWSNRPETARTGRASGETGTVAFVSGVVGVSKDDQGQGEAHPPA